MTRAIRAILHRGVAFCIASSALVAPAFCTTWIVDKNNGPGTNFLNIPSAVAAAAPGDVIIVRAGVYAGFTLSKGVAILGQGTVSTSSDVLLSGVPAGEIAALCHVNVLPVQASLLVANCAGTVLIQNLQSEVHITASADVRLFSSYFAAWYFDALTITDSRVQVVQSTLYGAFGEDADCNGGAGPGGDGIFCEGASRVHFALSTATGGTGGAPWPFCFEPGANGGNGVKAFAFPGVTLELIFTGGGGIGLLAGGNGYPNGYSAWLDNAKAWSSQMSYSSPPALFHGSTVTYSTIEEPTLELIGAPTPGNVVTLRLHAAAGVAARINLGRAPLVQPQPGILIEGLVLKERSFDRGLVPPSGVIDTPWQILPSAQPGKLLIFQCKVTDPNTNLTQKSNSIEVIVQ